jgi:hypothetical protein
MKKHMRTIIAALALAAMLGGAAYAATGSCSITVTYRDIKLVVDGKLVTPRDAGGNAVEPFLYNGTTYLPVRAVGEAFGKDVHWDGKTGTVYVGGVMGYDKPDREIALGTIPYIEIGDSEGYRADGGTIKLFSKNQTTFSDGRRGYCNYVVYPLNTAATRFTATLNPPKYPAFKPELTYKVYGDGALLYASPAFFGDSAAARVDIDVSGVKQMKIEAALVSSVWNSFNDAAYRGIEDAIIITTDY